MIRNKKDGLDYKIHKDEKGYYYIKNGKKKYVKSVISKTKPTLKTSNFSNIKLKDSNKNKITVN